jgi:hypothetical protein
MGGRIGAVRSALFFPAGGNGPGRAPPHGLRPGYSRAGVSSAGGLVDRAASPSTICRFEFRVGHTSLFKLYAAAFRTIGACDARSVFGGCNGGDGVRRLPDMLPKWGEPPSGVLSTQRVDNLTGITGTLGAWGSRTAWSGHPPFGLISKQKCERFGKAPGPGRFVMCAAIFDDQAETTFLQSAAAQDCGQFAHVVDHTLIAIFAP